MKSVSPLFVIFTLLTSIAAGVTAREYMAPIHNSKWTASSSDGECLLQHDIPGFGNSILRQSAQESLRFELHISQDVDMGTQCSVEISPPPWRHDMPTQGMGTIKIVPEAKHLQAKGGAAQKIYQGLEAGMQTVFTCQSQNNPQANMRVVISPVRYLIALPSFQKCTAALASEKKVDTKPVKKSKRK